MRGQRLTGFNVSTNRRSGPRRLQLIGHKLVLTGIPDGNVQSALVGLGHE
jgi:hypothetical protein